MTYRETIDYLFHVAPMFQNIGAGAYKEGLATTLALDSHFHHPHRAYRTLHVAGTNGKGTVSHTLAAVLQSAGYRVGLFTSPHLLDFRERIRVDGEMIPEARVVRFVEEERGFFEPLSPSFFELTTALAFTYFAEQKVDIAVVEVGMGGRLDCTNIIRPMVSVITNISFDHMQFLGNTLPLIAAEKAGIMKAGVPVVVGETGDDDDVRRVFMETAERVGTPLRFACDAPRVLSSRPTEEGGRLYETATLGRLVGALGGACQEANTNTLLAVLDLLRPTLRLTDEAVREGFRRVCDLTGLQGRWQVLARHPFTVCDTGHNPAGLQYIGAQLSALPAKRLRVVVGMVGDKDVRGSLALLPAEADYYYTQASVARAMPAHDIAALGREMGREGSVWPSVGAAYRAAKADADADDCIYIGGSTFVVADLLRTLQ